MQPSRIRAGLMWLAFVGATFVAALPGVFFPPDTWYATLTKPSWTPPGWLFGPVWTVLYVLIGTSGWLVWRKRGWVGARGAWGAFLLQLVLNGAWTCLFFGLHRPDWAFIDIAALWLAIAATTVLFWHRQRLAAGLLLPYLAWVGFAAALNFALWRLNA